MGTDNIMYQRKKIKWFVWPLQQIQSFGYNGKVFSIRIVKAEGLHAFNIDHALEVVEKS